jgi:uncharacterized repeat protein (TIGR03803 family)
MSLICRQLKSAKLPFVVLFALLVVLSSSAQAQTFTVLHNFTAGADGANPVAGLTMDRTGNFYGTTSAGGAAGSGTVYKVSRTGSGWIETPLYSFQSGADGAAPLAGVVFGPNGSLYGTTSAGGQYDIGTVFNLRPPAHASANILAGWTESVLYHFTGGTDGNYPGYGDLIFDQAGNLYGTTQDGGYSGGNQWGTVFELMPSNRGWTESIIYTFNVASGAGPLAGLVFDRSGNLYGTAQFYGPAGYGTVYQLTFSGSGWTEDTLFGFSLPYGATPIGGLIFDEGGNLYGTTTDGGPDGNGGTVFELTPENGNWTYTILHSFSGTQYGVGPHANLVMDPEGNLYGTTFGNGIGYGSVFKLTPMNGGWTYADLHDFNSTDGAAPTCSLTIDPAGNLYGTTEYGGQHGYGVVFEITP